MTQNAHNHTQNNHTQNNHEYDEYEEQMERFGLIDRKSRRHRGRANPKAVQSKAEIVAQLAEDVSGLESGFQITYRPARFEEGWLLDSLRTFYEQGLIADVLSQIKGGKEASVYLCRANPDTGLDLVAVKVYRPRQFRNLSNDAMYREGREILSSEGGIIKRRDGREMRAMKKKTGFGAELLHESWLMYEHGTMQQLYKMGAAVPKPIAAASNALLMEYIGDAHMAAPILHAVTLDAAESHGLFSEVMRNIELMLKHELIHGDLSAYNLLYWEGKVTLIDFPQITMAMSNRNAYKIFHRDVQRVCEYFQSQGVPCDGDELAEQLWWKHIGVEPGQKMTDLPDYDDV